MGRRDRQTERDEDTDSRTARQPDKQTDIEKRM